MVVGLISQMDRGESRAHLRAPRAGRNSEALVHEQSRDMLDNPPGREYASTSTQCSGAVQWMPPAGDLNA